MGDKGNRKYRKFTSSAGRSRSMKRSIKMRMNGSSEKTL